MSTASFLGLDQSVNHAGVAILKGCNEFHAFTEATKLMGSARLDFWACAFRRLVEQYSPTGVAIEGYAFGSKSQAHTTGEVGGLARLMFYRLHVPVLVVPPNVLKKFATGSPNADKSLVAVHLFKRWGYEVVTNDESDAGVLSLMAEAKFGKPRLPLTKLQEEALTKCVLLPAKPRQLVPVRARQRVQQVAQAS